MKTRFIILCAVLSGIMVAAQQEIPVVELDREEGSVCSVTELEIAKQEIRTNVSNVLEQITGRNYTCGGTGSWRRVVYLDMTDNSATCPSGWQLTTYSKRTCGRVTAGRFICDSTIFPVYGEEYTQVCGRIKAYQFSRPDAFEAYDGGDVTTIDYAYMCGVSLTHGSPRRHIWTFANSHTEDDEANIGLSDHCPCETTYEINVPPFVGADYFCESAVNSGSSNSGQFYQNDPLWDGLDCMPSSMCCSFNTPPYFTKQLPAATTDDIEARICQMDRDDDSAIELVELYVQ